MNVLLRFHGVQVQTPRIPHLLDLEHMQQQDSTFMQKQQERMPVGTKWIIVVSHRSHHAPSLISRAISTADPASATAAP
jgi:hypothetical protein